MTKFKTIIRPLIKKTFEFSLSFIPQISRLIKHGLTVFVFHEVSDHPSPFSIEYGLSVSRETFYRQVSWIKSNFKVIHPDDILKEARLPENAAMISFDDGFLSTFENGLPILDKMGLPSVIFLNMKAILEHTPILSATACYLNRYVPNFSIFMNSEGLSPPFHLSLSPSILDSFIKRYGLINKDSVLSYQGHFANLKTLQCWKNRNIVVYGNHLYDHWNAPTLNPDEFIDQYIKNEEELRHLNNRINLFAFTNGRPETCFSYRELNILKKLGAKKVFSATMGVNLNSSKYLLGRISLSESDNDESKLLFQVGRAIISNILHKEKK
ncbi:MAG: polysaccharide deacetylase family protein [Desulfobacterales bacterium]|nr:polysaccharide deacetylase family protein [Desulfobacterales bacterium]